ncbi:MAG: UDP-N-acetylglucosamine-1-phosphate transferase, partial [Thaumarchaeota archaeon]|nr:UDP-N-acetylglucosamine-1-phosphate transferase [Nitrososphaerota archaeon]
MSSLLVDPQFFAAVALTAATLTAVITYVSSRLLIRLLSKRGRVVTDFHKQGKPMIPKPGGPAIILGLVVGETLLYLFTQQTSLLALVATLIIAGAIGLLDDTVTLGGAVKPALLVLASLPILLLGTYDFNLALPFFGTVRLSIIYPMLVLLAIPVTSNTVNTIDVLNGVVSGFILIASIPLILALLLFGEYVVAAAAIIFATAAASFYLVHKYPSRI